VLKLIKKSLIVVGVLAIAGFLIFGAGLSSYLRTGYKQVKSQIRSSIPVEFEIHRIEDLVEEISPEMHQVQQLIAEEQVAVATLKEEIDGKQRSATNRSTEVKIIRASLDSTSPRIQLGGRTWSRELVESDLTRRLDGLKALSSLIESKKRLLTARERALEAAKDKLVNISTERTRLLTIVEQLRAELREQQTLQSSSLKVKIDDSKLKQAQELAQRVKTRLKVNRQKLQNEGIFEQPKIDLKPVLVEPRDIRAEVDAFFSGQDSRALEQASGALTRN